MHKRLQLINYFNFCIYYNFKSRARIQFELYGGHFSFLKYIILIILLLVTIYIYIYIITNNHISRMYI